MSVEGSTVANSNTHVGVTNQLDNELYFSFIQTFAAGDVFRIKVNADDVNIVLDYTAASGVVPGTVAAELIIRKISKTP